MYKNLSEQVSLTNRWGAGNEETQSGVETECDYRMFELLLLNSNTSVYVFA